jgi:hypothetical protein
MSTTWSTCSPKCRTGRSNFRKHRAPFWRVLDVRVAVDLRWRLPEFPDEVDVVGFVFEQPGVHGIG